MNKIWSVLRLLEYFCAVLAYFGFRSMLKMAHWTLFRRGGYRNPGVIMVFRTGHLGDTLCAVPALKAVRAGFPHARLLLMTNHTRERFPVSKDVLDRIVDFDEVIPYDPQRLSEVAYVYGLVSILRKKRVDLLVYLGQSIVTPARLLRDMLFFWMAGCRSACGFTLNILPIFSLAQRQYSRFDREPERLMKLIQPLGVSTDIEWAIPHFPLDTAELVVSLNGPLIAIHPSAKYAAKKWPIDRFVEVARHLQDRHDATIVIVGGSDCVYEAELLSNTLDPAKLLNLAGKTTFLETAQILRRCRFLLSNDSGPVHIAAAVNTPVVGIYSARDFPNAWYPWGDDHVILRKDVDCQICYLASCPTMSCLRSITVDEVIVACEQILGKAGNKSAETPNATV